MAYEKAKACLLQLWHFIIHAVFDFAMCCFECLSVLFVFSFWLLVDRVDRKCCQLHTVLLLIAESVH